MVRAELLQICQVFWLKALGRPFAAEAEFNPDQVASAVMHRMANDARKLAFCIFDQYGSMQRN